MIVRSKAPLRLGLAGGGTDLSPYCDEYGGYVLNASINLNAYCTIEFTDNQKISFYATDRNEAYETVSCSFIEPDGLLDLHKGVYNRIIKQFRNGEPLSFKMVTYSDAPAGSGLGSSSTLVVAMVQAFVEALNLPLGEYDIAHLSYEIERCDIGMPGGKQDQYAATFGGFNFIEFYANDRVIVNPLRVKAWIINELENQMVLYYSGISRQSEHIIKEQTQNTQGKETDGCNAMHELKKYALVMKEAILKGDIQKFGEYLGKSWGSKKRTSSLITNPYLENIYEEAFRSGAYAGKISGAGGGGFMMFMVDPTKKMDIINRLKELGGNVMHFNFVEHGAQAWRLL